MSRLESNTVYTFIDKGEAGMSFRDINVDFKKCKVKIDLDFLSTLNNIYTGTASMFSNFEYLLETYFPQPLCQTLKFNFPQQIAIHMPLYKKFPRVLPKFLNANLKVPYACILFESNTTAQALPTIFIPALNLFSKIFRSVQSSPQNRIKRDTFTRFLEFVFGDASMLTIKTHS